jgi:hypothetical protein
LTVTAKKRDYVGEPGKYLGHGRCTDYSKSVQVDRVIKDPLYLFTQAWKLFTAFDIPAVDVRGIGIHLKKQQDVADASDFFKKRKTDDTYESPKKKLDISKWTVTESQVDRKVFDNLPSSIQQEQRQLITEKELQSQHVLPTFSQIDPQVLKCLPKHIQIEQREIAKKKQRPAKVEPVKVYEPPSLGGETDLVVISAWIDEWIEACQDEPPEQTDVLEVTKFLASLVEDCNTVQCCKYLKKISRGFVNANLQDFVQFIVDNVNEEVKKTYGNVLDPLAYL